MYKQLTHIKQFNTNKRFQNELLVFKKLKITICL